MRSGMPLSARTRRAARRAEAPSCSAGSPMSSCQDMVILGSGTIVSQLTPARLIDEYQLVVNPIILGKGRTMFEGVKDRLDLKRTSTRNFRNGNVVLCYEPMA